MKAVKAAKTTGPAAPLQQRSQLPQVDCADPTLQGTYVAQDDDIGHDNGIDDFEARLANGGAPVRSNAPTGRAQPRAQPHASGTTAPAPQVRKPTAAPALKKSTPSGPPLTEEEEERRQDIDDVRQLRTGRDDSSSDDE